MGRLAYLTKSLARHFERERFVCPNCDSSGGPYVSRKYLITALRRCSQCKLLFRTPTDDPAESTDYYESEYSQGFITELPSEDGLKYLIRTGFAGSGKSWAYYNSVLGRLNLGPGSRIFDFGCSWGYGSYQMTSAGYQVTAFEIAPTRRKYAQRNLGVDMVEDLTAAGNDPNLAGKFDCFFSAHVLEHVPRPKSVFELADQLLRPGGIFVSFTPNGSEQARAARPQWDSLWGQVHPNYIDDRFLDYAFRAWPRVAGSSPVDALEFPSDPILSRVNELSGDELFFAARKV